MTIHLPQDVERYVHSQVQCGRFASADEAIAEAVRRLRQAGQPSRPRNVLTEAEFKQSLLAAGLMTSLPAPADAAARSPLQPVAVEGEPLSERIKKGIAKSACCWQFGRLRAWLRGICTKLRDAARRLACRQQEISP